MTPEILQFLKDNLKIRISSDSSYSYTMDGSERRSTSITVSLALDDEKISSDSTSL